jgi:predicted transcriptional regulator YheO
MNKMRTMQLLILLGVGLILGQAHGEPANDTGVRCKALQSTDFSDIPDALTQVITAELVEPTDETLGYCEVNGYVAPSVGFLHRRPTDTELGLARIADPKYPQVVANHANQFADGRQAKSTSIGIEDSSGRYIAALCMNVDLTLFRSLQTVLGQFSDVDTDAALKESLNPASANAIRARIDEYAARLNTTPRSLKTDDRRALMRALRDSGLMEIRRAMEIVTRQLGVSRATVYSDVK